MALIPAAEGSKSARPVLNPSLTGLQRTSLQGLIRFSSEATRPEDVSLKAVKPLDEEEKKFLEAPLSSMSIDRVQILQNQIKILRGVEHMTKDEVVKYLKALDVVTSYVDNVENAKDFHKIGGFLVLYPCLKTDYPKITAMTCELLAGLCKNNSYSQTIMLDNNFLPFLLNLVEQSEDIHVKIQAISALGEIIKDNKRGVSQFLHYKGLSIMFKTLKGTNDNVIIQTCILLSSVCRLTPKIKGQLIKLGFVQQLLTLFMMPRCPSHEYVLPFLVAIMEDCTAAVRECKKFQYNVKDIFHRHMTNMKHKENCEEEDEYCRRILHMLNSLR